MGTTGVIAVVVGVVLLGALIWAVRTFNRLVALRNQTGASWAQVEVQLERRHDLVPNLVATVERYAAHERGTLEAVTAARGAAVAGRAGTAARAKAENELTAKLGGLFALAEGYPELAAAESFRQLQAELARTEDKIAYARQFYNSAVQSYNTAQETFPGTLFAGGHTRKEYFEAETGARETVRVRFA
ncbi:LemA family protein [Streptomyces sp. NPDC089919]|uniref:LemA family protein n=1 Tax=Streptomyces sp. NPDC089919 TaxID=3155188 RepID=UPI003421605E